MLKKDNFTLGMAIGLVLPLAFYGLLRIAGLWIHPGTMWTKPFEPERMLLISLIINVIPIRLYFVSYKFDKTGRGILLITFLLMVVFFLYKRLI
jgi:hypothetical protein